MVNKHLWIVFLRLLNHSQNFWAREISSYTVCCVRGKQWREVSLQYCVIIISKINYLFHVLHLVPSCPHTAPEVPFVNDTIVGDPLLTVPLTNLNLNGLDLGIEGQPSLCFEIHGDSNTYFNLVTDNCVTVNARYHPLNDYWNVINQIGVRAVNEMGQCKNIAVDLDRCTASVDGVALTTNYRSAGIYVRPYRNQVRISVPNCNVSSHLVMYVFCQQNLTVWDPFTDEPFTASMIKYVIAHGLNLNENSHGLIGECEMCIVLHNACDIAIYDIR